MGNADLIERLRNAATFGTCLEAADALALADKRIAELEELLDERHEDYRRERDRLNEENSAVLECLKEAERKLSVAREALKYAANELADFGVTLGSVEEALAQIGGVTPADPQSTPLTRGSKSADS